MKTLAHSKDNRDNELITYQFELPTYLLPELLKFKKMEITWERKDKFNTNLANLQITNVTLTTSKPVLMEFFDKVCSKYNYSLDDKNFKSKKEFLKYDTIYNNYIDTKNDINSFDWGNLNQNTSTDIYLQQIAEQMYDLYNESETVELEENGWHIPFQNEIDYRILPSGNSNLNRFIEISTALISNPTEKDYSKLIKIHDQLLENNELDTFVHCARVMNDEEYENSIKSDYRKYSDIKNGWCEFYKGFISYKNIIENENII